MKTKHFFTKQCHRQTYQNYEQSRQKLGSFLEDKIFQKSKFSKTFILKVSLLVQYSSKNFFFEKIHPIFNTEKWLKIRILRCSRRLLITFVSLTMTLFREKMVISTRCMWFHVQLDQKILKRTPTFIQITCLVHCMTTDAQWSLFSLKYRTFGLEQTNWADKFWGIWGLLGGTINTFFLYSESFIHVFHYSTIISTKKLSLYIYISIIYLGSGFEFGPQRIRVLAFVCP